MVDLRRQLLFQPPEPKGIQLGDGEAPVTGEAAAGDVRHNYLGGAHLRQPPEIGFERPHAEIAVEITGAGPAEIGPVEPHLDIVLNGKPGSAMPPWKGLLNDLEIAAIVTYERNAWGNDTGDVVQPRDVKAMRSLVLK